MADKSKNVVLNFKMDGQVQYAETIREINSVMNTAAKEYKNHIAAMGNDAKATDKLRAEKKKLEIQMEGAQKRTKMLSAQYEAMAKDTKTTTGQLTQMYGKLLDAEKAESSLQKSMDRVNDGLSDQAQEARDAKENLDKLKSESKLLESQQKNLTSSFKLQNEELGDNASETEKAELAQKQLQAQTKLTDRTMENLEKQLAETKKVYGENSIEVNQMETKLNNARSTIKKFEKSLDGIDDSAKKAGDGMEDLGKKMDLNNLLEATELLQGVSDKMLEVGTSSFTASMELGDSQTILQANLGVTADEAEKLNEVVDQVFRNGVVGSVDEATQAVILAKQTFKDLNNVELEDLTNKLTTISKRTGTDVQANVRAAEQLMIGFGITGSEATDLIATGFQNGLNKSGDFLDTLTEYAPHFENAGYNADEMLQIINNGMENGAMNTDKAADAVKEFQIRLGDGSIEKVIENYSKDTQDMFKKWQNGKATVADVATSIGKDINKMSPQEQQVAVSELASQFEDLGVDGAAALFSVGEGFTDVNGKADEMAKKTPGEKWESSLRELKSALVPLGESITEAVTPVIEMLIDLSEWFTNLSDPVKTFITVFAGVLGIMGALTPIIVAIIGVVTIFGSALLPIIAIVLGVAAAIAGIILVIKNWGAITDWIGEKWNQFTKWLSEGVSKLATNFVKWFNDMKTGAINKFNELKDSATNRVNELKTKAENTLTNFKNNAINKVNELKTGFINKVDELKSGAINKFNDLKNGAVNVVVGFKNNVVDNVNDLKNGFVNKVNDLKDSAINKFNYLKNTAGNVMSAAYDVIVSPIQSAKDKIGGIIDGIKGFFSRMKLRIPKIDMPPLPHFSISGDFDLVPPNISVPKIGIDWYAKGGIFTQPTIFGASGGSLKGMGEAGPEAALPLNEQTLGDIGKGVASTMGRQSLIVQMVTPDKRVLAEMVVEDVSEIQERKSDIRNRFK